MKKYILKTLFASALAAVPAVQAVDGIIDDGQWEIMEEPMQVGNLGLAWSAGVHANSYDREKGGHYRRLNFECSYGVPSFTIQYIGDDLSPNNKAVVYSLDDGPKQEWYLSTKNNQPGEYIKVSKMRARSITEELRGHKTITLYLKLGSGKTDELVFDIANLEENTKIFALLCGK